MPRKSTGPKLWLDKKRGTWTIIDGSKRVRTGYAESKRDLAVISIHEYSNGTYTPDRAGSLSQRPKDAKRGVYVAGFGSYVKIGITTNLDSRMAQLQTPEPMMVYALLDGWAAEERELHERFSEYRLRGEWFRRDGQLAAWINSGCQQADNDNGANKDVAA